MTRVRSNPARRLGAPIYFRARANTFVITVLLGVTGGMTPAAPAQATTPKRPPIPIELIGWLCVAGDQIRVVIDDDSRRVSTGNVDCPGGRTLRGVPNLVRRFATERDQGWRRSRSPLRLTGETNTLSAGWLSRFRVRSAAMEAAQRDRFSTSLATPELPPATRRASAVPPSLIRSDVFDQLPEFAEAVPSATVRTKRIYADHRFGYVADVRTTAVDGPAATTTVSQRLGIAAVATTVAATRIASNECPEAAEAVRRSMAASVLAEFGPARIDCDEATQVVIVHAPAINMSTLSWPPEFDVVLDTSVRVG